LPNLEHEEYKRCCQKWNNDPSILCHTAQYRHSTSAPYCLSCSYSLSDHD
jgi:hypothetical protein